MPEILGTLDPLLRRSGFRIRYVNFGRDPEARPSIDGYQGLIVLGGPMNVGEADRYPHLRTEQALIEGAIEAMREGVGKRAAEEGLDGFVDMIGDETTCTSAEQLVEHWPEVLPQVQVPELGLKVADRVSVSILEQWMSTTPMQ